MAVNDYMSQAAEYAEDTGYWSGGWNRFLKAYETSWNPHEEGSIAKSYAGAMGGLWTMAQSPFSGRDVRSEFWRGTKAFLDSAVNYGGALLRGTIGGVFELPAINSAVQGIDWAYRQSVARPSSWFHSAGPIAVAAAEQAKREGRDPTSAYYEALFDHIGQGPWGPDAQKMTMGQAFMWNLGTYVGMVDGPSASGNFALTNDPRTPEGLVRYTGDPAQSGQGYDFWLKYGSGSADFMGVVVFDPTILLGAAAKAARFRMQHYATPEYINKGGVEAEIGSRQYELTKQAARDAKTPEELRDRVMSKARFGGRASVLLWAASRLGDDVFRDTYVVLRRVDGFRQGGKGAKQRLIESAPLIASKMADLFANWNIGEDALAFGRSTLADDAAKAQMSLAMTNYEAFTIALQQGEGIWGRAPGMLLGEAQPRITKLSELRRASHSLFVGGQYMSEVKVGVLGRAGGFLQRGASKAAATAMPSQGWTSFLDLEDSTGLGLKQFKANLERSGMPQIVLGGKDGKTPVGGVEYWVSQYAAKGERTGRGMVLEQAQSAALKAVASRHGVDPAEVEKHLPEIMRWSRNTMAIMDSQGVTRERFTTQQAARMGAYNVAKGIASEAKPARDALKERMDAESKGGNFKKVPVDFPGFPGEKHYALPDQDGKLTIMIESTELPKLAPDIANPIMTSQQRAWAPTIDFRALDGQLKWYRWQQAGGPMRAIAKLQKPTMGAIRGGDFANMIWKSFALLRPAQLPRNLADDVMRRMIIFGKLPLIMSTMRGTKRAFQNAKLRTDIRFEDSPSYRKVMRQYERVAKRLRHEDEAAKRARARASGQDWVDIDQSAIKADDTDKGESKFGTTIPKPKRNVVNQQLKKIQRLLKSEDEAQRALGRQEMGQFNWERQVFEEGQPVSIPRAFVEGIIGWNDFSKMLEAVAFDPTLEMRGVPQYLTDILVAMDAGHLEPMSSPNPRPVRAMDPDRSAGQVGPAIPEAPPGPPISLGGLVSRLEKFTRQNFRAKSVVGPDGKLKAGKDLLLPLQKMLDDGVHPAIVADYIRVALVEQVYREAFQIRESLELGTPTQKPDIPAVSEMTQADYEALFRQYDEWYREQSVHWNEPVRDAKATAAALQALSDSLLADVKKRVTQQRQHETPKFDRDTPVVGTEAMSKFVTPAAQRTIKKFSQAAIQREFKRRLLRYFYGDVGKPVAFLDPPSPRDISGTEAWQPSAAEREAGLWSEAGGEAGPSFDILAMAEGLGYSIDEFVDPRLAGREGIDPANILKDLQAELNSRARAPFETATGGVQIFRPRSTPGPVTESPAAVGGKRVERGVTYGGDPLSLEQAIKFLELRIRQLRSREKAKSPELRAVAAESRVVADRLKAVRDALKSPQRRQLGSPRRARQLAESNVARWLDDVVQRHIQRRKATPASRGEVNPEEIEHLGEYAPGELYVDPFSGETFPNATQDTFTEVPGSRAFSQVVNKDGSVNGLLINEVENFILDHLDAAMRPDAVLYLSVNPMGEMRVGIARHRPELEALAPIKSTRKQRLKQFSIKEAFQSGRDGLSVKMPNGEYLDFEGPFVGDAGEAMMARVSARMGQGTTAMLQEEYMPLRMMEQQGGFDEIAPGQRGYEESWERAVNAQIAGDAVAQKFLAGWTDLDVIRWLERTKEGTKWIYSMRFLGTNYVDQVRIIQAHVNELIPLWDDSLEARTLRQAALERKATHGMYAAAVPNIADRAAVHGASLRFNMGKGAMFREIAHRVDKAQQYLFDIPTDKASRFPFFSEAWRRHLNDLTKAWSLTDEAAQYKYAMPAEIVDRLQQQARERAYYDTKYRLYDTTQANDLAKMTRFVVPFSSAIMDSLMKYGRLVREDPTLILRGMYYWEMFERADLIQDENGYQLHKGPTGEDQWYTVDPTTGKEIRVDPDKVGDGRYVTFRLPSSLGHVLGNKDYYGVPTAPVYQINKKSFNVFLDMAPTTGPFVGLPANEFALSHPEFAENEIVKKYVLPFGPRAGEGRLDRIREVALPSTLKSAWTAFEGEDGNKGEAQAKAIFQAELIAYGREERDTPPTIAEARERAAMLKGLRFQNFASAWLTPVSYQVMSPYQPYINIYRQMMATDPEHADEAFLAQYGDEMYAVMMTTTRNTGSIRATLESHKVYKAHSDMVAAFPELGGLITGLDGGTFSKAVYESQKQTPIRPGGDENLRKVLSLDESVQDLQKRMVWDKYTKMMDVITAEMQERGLTSLSQRGAQKYREVRDKFIAQNATWIDPGTGFETPSPWYQDFSEMDLAHMDNRIAAMWQIVQDPILQQRDDIRGLIEYLAARKRFQQEMERRGIKSLSSQRARPLLRRWQATSFSIQERNPAFARVYNRYLSHDIDLGY